MIFVLYISVSIWFTAAKKTLNIFKWLIYKEWVITEEKGNSMFFFLLSLQTHAIYLF